MPDTPFSSHRLMLDTPLAVGSRAVRASRWLSLAIVVTAMVVLAYGDIPLRAYPQFVPFHVASVFMLDAVTAFLLFGQFHYRRLPLYLILGGGYLFNALIAFIFMLAFPASGNAYSGIIGGPQSAIWLWHYWHLLFPVFVSAALLLHHYLDGRRVPKQRLWRDSLIVSGGVLLLAGVLTWSVTYGHHALPVLLDVQNGPSLTTAFYWTGGLAAGLTLVALLLAWYYGRQRIMLHLWLAVAMTAFLADIAASLGAHERYTVGWYFGRIEALVAASVLLLVFLYQVVKLYTQLGNTVIQLSRANRRMTSLLDKYREAESELAEKNRELEQLSKTDYLTQLRNRQSIEWELHTLIESAQRYQRHFSVLILDIDHFKRVNDTYGHNVGDRVLRKIAGLLSLRVRATDMVGRWGGEEFMIACAETDLNHATGLAEALRALIAESEFSLAFPITVSIGVAEYRSGEHIYDLVLRADNLLYLAKSKGRNCVVADDEQPPMIGVRHSE